MSSNKFTITLSATADRETMTLVPSPYIRGDALVTCTGRRGRDLCRAMSGTPSGRTGDAFHLTARRAEKCHALFSAGFSAVLEGVSDWRYKVKDGPPVLLSEALRTAEVMV